MEIGHFEVGDFLRRNFREKSKFSLDFQWKIQKIEIFEKSKIEKIKIFIDFPRKITIFSIFDFFENFDFFEFFIENPMKIYIFSGWIKSNFELL